MNAENAINAGPLKTSESTKPAHVCPWWVGYLLASPVRKWWENPQTILAPHIREGMTVLDVGPGMGYFTLPAARMAGETGRVVAVDLQARMIRTLERRSYRAGLDKIIDPRVCSEDSLMLNDLRDQVDFALAYHMLHETPSLSHTLQQIWDALKPGGRLLVAEPRGHVTDQDFDDTRLAARQIGFRLLDGPLFRRSHTVLLEKPAGD